MLDTQINIYSVDTGHFYSNHEKYLHGMNCKYRQERNFIKNRQDSIAHRLREIGYSQNEVKSLKNGHLEEVDFIDGTKSIVNEFIQCEELIKHKRAKAKESKDKLLKILSNKVKNNDHIRDLREADLTDLNIISEFESELTRTIGIAADELTDEVIVVQIFYFDLFKDIFINGFMYKGQKYRYYTSSAGQIRKKKAVFIKESTWDRISKTIMCGLTFEDINARGGINANKFLAYLALSNSATDRWNEFDIDKAIVIDDFENLVYGTYDYIDPETYTITRTTDYVPIPQTDGIGMMLPSVSRKNFMFRAPFIKGLLGVFDFKRFIKERGCSPIIKDIYGKEHNVIEEDIKIIFTKSQFKLWKFYDSWDDYKGKFKEYGCHAGRCHMEVDRVKNAKINYQMLQTLTDITSDEIDALTKASNDKLNHITDSVENMMECLGITPYNTNPTPFQQAVKIYPSLLQDSYTRDIIKEIRNSLLQKYRSGKLEISGKYTFILPDLFAACEYWFEGNQNPKGLLGENEVFCSLYKNSDRLDCLRSPHLYKEHGLRDNIAAKKEKYLGIRKWFPTIGLYTSSHDLLSKLLMFDVDGDTSLVVADEEFIKVVERNMDGIVPLYYPMKKAKPSLITAETMYSGLINAFIGGNIGIYSNNISKIWNDDVFITGNKEAQEEAMYLIKCLCCQNNHVIDFAKTLYKPEFPPEVADKVSKFSQNKLPAFFKFAKDKAINQVSGRNKSFVNEIYNRIKTKTLVFKKIKLPYMNYRYLMANPNIEVDERVIETYKRLNKRYQYIISNSTIEDSGSYLFKCLSEEFEGLNIPWGDISDMLVKHLYGMKRSSKQMYWQLFGNTAVSVLKKKIKVPRVAYRQCDECGEFFEITYGAKSHPTKCQKCNSL